MKTCTTCGKAIDDGCVVCPFCGATVAAETAGATAPQQETSAYQQTAYQQPAQTPYQQPQFAAAPSYQQPKPSYTPEPRPQRSAYIAALLAFFFGAFGIYNFYLDNKNKAILQLVLGTVGSIFFGLGPVAMEIWAIIEAIQILKGEINTDGTGAKIKMSF